MKPAICVLGSTNMDLVAYVATAPRRGETVAGREFRTIPGGKGLNQAIAAARAGAAVTMIGAVGEDEFGTRLRATLAEAGVDVAALRTVPGPSGTAHIVVDDEGGNSIVVVPGANASVTGLAPGDERRIAAALSVQRPGASSAMPLRHDIDALHADHTRHLQGAP
jgi:ribokinase